MNKHDTLSSLLIEIRGKLDLNQSQLAKRAGLSQSAWSKLERGQTDVALSKYKKLIRSFKNNKKVQSKLIKFIER